jgi:diketogulonate reductase-like aldo/keto reductase
MKTPAFLYGTAWKEDQTERHVTEALTAGFRGIDTANQRKHYHEAGVGAALKKAFESGRVSRGELFLQTKFTFLGGQDHRLPYDPKARIADQVRQSFASSLEHLHTDYLDSYVLHGPSGPGALQDDDWDAWGAMCELHAEGKARALGISNVSGLQLKSLFANAKVKPAFVQNRCYARTGWDHGVRELCRAQKIVYQGFSLLTANTQILKHPDFAEIVWRVGCTPAQAIFAFALGVGMLPLTGTTDTTHMAEDLRATSVHLEKDDLDTIEGLLL